MSTKKGKWKKAALGGIKKCGSRDEKKEKHTHRLVKNLTVSA